MSENSKGLTEIGFEMPRMDGAGSATLHSFTPRTRSLDPGIAAGPNWKLSSPNGILVPDMLASAGGLIKGLETDALSQILKAMRPEPSEAIAGPAADPITPLASRSVFRERLTAMLSRPLSEIEPAAVLVLDLDHYKTVSQTLGPGLGDKLLAAVGRRINSAIGERDFASHFGSDEFAVIQPGQQPQAAAALAERLTDLIGRSYIIDGQMLNIGATIGIAVLPAHGSNYEQILRKANLALRSAKLEARGGFRFFADAIDEAMQARRSLELDLRRALALRELALVYQPQYNVATKRITGFETLLRWNHPTRGLVSPTEFIPMAEEIGLITPIGEWVIRTACRDAARWPEPLNVAVNISALQFRSPHLATTILSGIAESGLQPRRLELEITESTLLTDHHATLDLLHQMRTMGVQVAMDDFGTGYSSLSYLRSFPFDKIKIDQSFVRGRADDRTGAAIIRAIAMLGESLGMTTIAEGVETEEQFARIAADGCTDVQGFLISKPMAAERVDDFLRGACPQRVRGMR